MLASCRLRIPLGFVALCILTAPVLLVAEEPARDLTPILPTARSLSSNTNNPYQFRNYGNGSVHSMSADGKLLLMSGGNGLMLWNLSDRDSGQPSMLNTAGINMYNCAAALSPDGKTAAVVPMYYRGDVAVRFFNTRTGKQLREIDNDEQITGLSFAPDGRLLAVSTRQRIELWNAEDGEEVRVFSGAQGAVYRLMTFSPDGKMLAALGNEPDTVHIWETASGKERGSVHFGAQTTPIGGGRLAGRRRFRAVFPGNVANNSGIVALAFSADSRLLAASKPESAIHLWDLQDDQELAPLTGFRGQVSAMVFSPDGKELIAIDSEGTRLSWRMARLRRNSNVRLAPLDDDDFAELWNDLAEPDSFRVYRARRHLTADPKRAVPLLSGRLEPVPAGNTARIQQLVKDLSSPNPGTRRKAMTDLRTKHGEAALGALMQSNGGGNPVPGMAPGMVMPGMGMAGGSQATMLLLQKLQAKYNTPERQRNVLAVGILEEIGTPEARQTLAKLSKGAPGVALTTSAKTALDHLAAAAKERPLQATPEQLWTDLGSNDAPRAFRAICNLTADPRQAVTLVRKQLKPVPVVEDREIVTLLDRLGSDDFQEREQATEALSKVGEQALPAMKKALSGDVPIEARKRLERLVEQTSSKASTPLLRGLRAIEVLEHTGTTECKHVLVALAGGAPQAQLTREAKASLERLTRR
ncbi:MAG TPA: hypothetical protein VMG10_03115 [Gemmataceae bacterium]|nr:hypothetical protein [Gemmataceae bacterium]